MDYIPKHAKNPPDYRGGVLTDEHISNPSRRALLAGSAAAFLAAAFVAKPSLAHAVGGDAASRDELAQLAYEIANLYYDVSGLGQSVSSFDGRLIQAERSLSGLDGISDKFPIENDDIADNSIGMGKLSDQAKDDIIQGMTIRHFDNKQYGADNNGLLCPASGALAGYYVPELTLLIITKYYKPYGMYESSWLSEETQYRLPSYVPHVTENYTFATMGVIDFDENGAYQDWHGFGVNPDGFVGGIGSSDEDEGRVLLGNVAAILRPYIALG